MRISIRSRWRGRRPSRSPSAASRTYASKH
jgi:hypothetical protein